MHLILIFQWAEAVIQIALFNSNSIHWFGMIIHFFFKFSFFSQIHFCCSSAETLKYKEFIINQKWLKIAPSSRFSPVQLNAFAWTCELNEITRHKIKFFNKKIFTNHFSFDFLFIFLDFISWESLCVSSFGRLTYPISSSPTQNSITFAHLNFFLPKLNKKNLKFTALKSINSFFVTKIHASSQNFKA